MKFALTASCVAALAAALAAAGEARAQKTTKVKYAEVVRSVFYLPKYVAIANGYFRDQGIEVDMTTAWGGDKGTAMLLTGKVDVVLQGPETAIYVENGASPEKTKMFTAITATDGLFLMSREKMSMEQFKWAMIKGKTVMGWRPGSTPGLFLEYAMKKHGISPKKDIDHVTNIAIPARVGAWMVNKASFSVFFEPDVSKLSRQGIAYPVASVGKEVGPVDYTVFMATDSYIKQNPKIVQGLGQRHPQGAEVDPDRRCRDRGQGHRQVVPQGRARRHRRVGHALPQVRHLEDRPDHPSAGDLRLAGHFGRGRRAEGRQAGRL